MTTTLPTEGKKSPKFLECVHEFFNDWKIRTVESHIMTKEQDETFTKGLKLPHLPDMVFAQNLLSITKNKSASIVLLTYKVSPNSEIKFDSTKRVVTL